LLQWRIVIEHESRLTMVFPGSIILYHADVLWQTPLSWCNTINTCDYHGAPW